MRWRTERYQRRWSREYTGAETHGDEFLSGMKTYKEGDWREMLHCIDALYRFFEAVWIGKMIPSLRARHIIFVVTIEIIQDKCGSDSSHSSLKMRSCYPCHHNCFGWDIWFLMLHSSRAVETRSEVRSYARWEILLPCQYPHGIWAALGCAYQPCY